MAIWFSDKLPPAQKITPELLRSKPWLAGIFRARAKQFRELKRERETEQPDLFEKGKPKP